MKNPMYLRETFGNGSFISRKIGLPVDRIGRHPENKIVLFEQNGSGLMVDHGYLLVFLKDEISKEEFEKYYNNLTWIHDFYRKVMFVQYLNALAQKKHNRNLWDGISRIRMPFIRSVLAETIRARFAEHYSDIEAKRDKFIVRHNARSLVKGFDFPDANWAEMRKIAMLRAAQMLH